jgi:carbon monoxide dehydrogenase subunit G
MKQVVATAEIGATPEAVWEFMDDAARFPEWVEATDRVFDVSDGPMREGYVYHEVSGVPPFKSRSRWEVTRYDPPRHQLHIGRDGTATMAIDIRLEPTASGTRLTLAAGLRPRPLMAIPMALLWPFLRGRAQELLDRTVDNLRRELEAGVAPEAGAGAPDQPA